MEAKQGRSMKETKKRGKEEKERLPQAAVERDIAAVWDMDDEEVWEAERLAAEQPKRRQAVFQIAPGGRSKEKGAGTEPRQETGRETKKVKGQGDTAEPYVTRKDAATAVTPYAAGLLQGGRDRLAAEGAQGRRQFIPLPIFKEGQADRVPGRRTGPTPERRFVPMPGSGLESGGPFPSAAGLMRGELPTLGTAGTGMDRITEAYLKQWEKEARAAQVIPLPTPTGRNPEEELRAEVRQRTRLGSGTDPVELTQQSTVRDMGQEISRREIEIEELEKEIGKVKNQMGQSYIMEGRPGVSTAMPYGAGAQIREVESEQRKPEHELQRLAAAKAEAAAARERAMTGRYDLNQLGRAWSMEQTATEEDTMAGLTGKTPMGRFNGLSGDASEAAMRINILQMGKEGEYGLYPELGYLSEAQKNTLLSLAGRGDWEGAGRYWKAIERRVNAAYQAAKSAETEAFSYDHPLLGGAINVGAGFTQPFAYGANAAQVVKNAITEEYEPTDHNSVWFRGAHAAQDTHQGVHRAAVEAAGGPETLTGRAAGFAADTALGLGGAAAKMATGPAMLPLLGLSAGGAATLDALERGGTPGKALTVGTVAGAAEVLAEKLPVEKLFDWGKKAPESVKELLLNSLKSVGIEAGQGAIMEIVNNMVDQAVMKDKSQYEYYVRGLMARGMNEQAARQEADRQFYVTNILAAGVREAIIGSTKEVREGISGRRAAGDAGYLGGAEHQGAYQPEGMDLMLPIRTVPEQTNTVQRGTGGPDSGTIPDIAGRGLESWGGKKSSHSGNGEYPFWWKNPQ